MLKPMPRLIAAALAFAGLLAAAPAWAGGRLFQYSTIGALLQGAYDGDLTVGELLRQGNLGLGTFNGLDGEMVVVDGQPFQVRSDGVVYPVPPDTRTPFATVTGFMPERAAVLPAGLDYRGLEKLLDTLAPNANHFQAFRIDGTFDTVAVRSVPAQTPPYRPLAKVVEEQSRFTLTGTRGTLIGLRAPSFAAGMNVPGYHFHYITADRTRGGHVLDLVAAEGRVAIADIADFAVLLPASGAFAAVNHGGATSADLEKVEKGR